MPLAYLSFASIPLVALKAESPVWQGTGLLYLWHEDDRQVLYVVTAYHTLTGLAPTSSAAPPVDEVVFYLHADPEAPAEVRPVRVPLYSRSGRPVWVTSERIPTADLAAIPVPSHVCEGCSIHYLDASWRAHSSDPLSSLTPVYALGFPYGYHDQRNTLPIWQSGLLASDPGFDFEREPKLAVEMPAYPGMSGAPAFFRRELGPPASAPGREPHSGYEFLGVYTAPPVDERGTFPEAFWAEGRAAIAARGGGQWGHVWHASLVEELVAAVDTERWEREILADLG